MRNDYLAIQNKEWEHDLSRMAARVRYVPPIEELLLRLRGSASFSLVSILDQGENFAEVLVSDGTQDYPLLLSLEPSEAIDFSLSVKGIDVSEQMMAEASQMEQEIVISMYYEGDVLAAYKIHLLLMRIIVPDMLLLIDQSAGNRIFSPQWLAFNSESNISPTLDDLYVVHMVQDAKNEEYWFHSHGLTRFGLPECEMIFKGEESLHYERSQVLQTFIRNSIQHQKVPLGQAVLLAQTEAGKCYGVAVPWEEGLAYIDNKVQLADIKRVEEDIYFPPTEPFATFLGDVSDRNLEHHGPSVLLFSLATEEKWLVPFFHDEGRPKELILFRPDEETANLKNNASLRWPYFVDIFQKHYQAPKKQNVLQKLFRKEKEPQWAFLAKFSFTNEADVVEHLWFEPVQVTEKDMMGRLINQPYYVKSLVVNQVYTLSIEQLSDWLVYYQGKPYSTDIVYLLLD